jgi:hypothetical protein
MVISFSNNLPIFVVINGFEQAFHHRDTNRFCEASLRFDLSSFINPMYLLLLFEMQTANWFTITSNDWLIKRRCNSAACFHNIKVRRIPTR